jgi:hypothetical protein
MSDDSMRTFLIDCMGDGIWHEGIKWLPLGASEKLARAAYDAIPSEIREQIEARSATPTRENNDD